MLAPFSARLLAWFDNHGRKDLPWQHDITPYHVWLSEIMLQQTQVSTVIDYYTRFISTYSDITALADADLDEVLALWTGLGYYARARNLHKAAQIMRDQYHSEMPDTLDALIALPGIGRSTAGAIMALAYQQPYPILDGNVKRVLARYAAIADWPGHKIVEQQLWQLAEDLLPTTRNGHYIQAQMDLGATICKRSKPLCQHCPLQEDCKAFQAGDWQNYPGAKPKKSIPTRQTHWLVARSHNGSILLEQRAHKGIWGGLWSFPEFDNASELTTFSQQNLEAEIKNIEVQTTIRHVFTHFKLDILPYLVHSSVYGQQIDHNMTFCWYTINDALRLGLPAPVKAFLKLLE